VNHRLGWIVAGVLVVAAVLRFAGLGAQALIGDEAHYWRWSQRLDWAYYDHPAGVALLVGASTGLGGQSEIGVRWLNGLLGTVCVLLTYRVGRRMLSRQAGLFAALLVAVGAPYVITSRFVYTNVLFLCGMLLNLLAFWRCTEQPASPGATTWFGVSFALLLNTKYSAYLYSAALLIGVLLDHRFLLSDRRFLGGLLIGGLGLVPVLAWNGVHGWASLQWQLSHATTALGGSYSFISNIRHLLTYLTPPLAVLALAGVGRTRSPAERLLSLIALFLLLPIIVSPANSPRNLTSGLVPLFILAGTRLPAILSNRRRELALGLLAVVMLATTIYGLGTVMGLNGASLWPQSSVVSSILKDTAGWREVGQILAASRGPVYALDYSIAGQIHYYTGRPAYTSHGQYRIWGIPHFEAVTIVSLEYLPEDLITNRLQKAFQHVEGPQRIRLTERGATKELRVWQARGLRINLATFLREFDFLTLLEESR
jgi:4-amino-4-deoxy-L-arabinose transferase-like glycosyltransferase